LAGILLSFACYLFFFSKIFFFLERTRVRMPSPEVRTFVSISPILHLLIFLRRPTVAGFICRPPKKRFPRAPLQVMNSLRQPRTLKMKEYSFRIFAQIKVHLASERDIRLDIDPDFLKPYLLPRLNFRDLQRRERLFFSPQARRTPLQQLLHFPPCLIKCFVPFLKDRSP